jgi:hypothetical protein
MARQPGTSSTESKQKTFQHQLERSLAGAESARSEETAAADGVSKRQGFADMARARHEVVTPQKSQKDLAGPFGGSGAAIPAEKPAAAPPTKEASAEAVDPVSVLRQAMQNAGIMSNIDLTISDEIVQYPGGAYRNHLIKANFGDGVTENYSVDLVMKNAAITALEMKRLMTGKA